MQSWSAAAKNRPILANSLAIISLFGEAILDFLFPTTCLICGEAGGAVCRSCQKSFTNAEHRCVVCSRKNPLGATCRGCVSKARPCIALSRFAYSGGVKQLIRLFKYEDVVCLKNFFAQELVSILKQIPDNGNYSLQPIPLHRAKLRKRGYNQSQLIARELSSQIKVPLTDSLIRVEATESQASSISKKQRELNIRGAFQVRKKPPAQIILIDDVITTGATMREAARVLIKAGCKKIVCISIAR